MSIISLILIIAFIQSWALSVFLNFLQNRLLSSEKMQKNNFLLLKKFKKYRSAQLCDLLQRGTRRWKKYFSS